MLHYIDTISRVCYTKVAVAIIYDAWGNCTVTLDNSNIGTLNPIRYRSYYFDTETGLYYLQSRYYDPQIERFINADSQFDKNAGLLKGILFAYCANNPVGCIDSTGTSSLSATDDYIEDDNPLNDYFGIGGGSGGGIAIIHMAGGTATAISIWTLLEVLKLKSKAKEKTKVKEIAISKEDTSREYYYWAAELIGKQVVILQPLSFAEACERVANYGNVMCPNQDAARAIIITNGYRNAVGPERGKGEGFYWHYHPTRNHTGHKYSTHIWFYGGVKYK